MQPAPPPVLLLVLEHPVINKFLQRVADMSHSRVHVGRGVPLPAERHRGGTGQPTLDAVPDGKDVLVLEARADDDGARNAALLRGHLHVGARAAAMREAARRAVVTVGEFECGRFDVEGDVYNYSGAPRPCEMLWTGRKRRGLVAWRGVPMNWGSSSCRTALAKPSLDSTRAMGIGVNMLSRRSIDRGCSGMGMSVSLRTR